MKINIKEAIEFLDSKSEKGIANSIIGVIGEDLNAYAFKHYLENEESCKVDILARSVTTGKSPGKRLDRWIYVEKKEEKKLYQCEIKNWAATAIGGRSLKVDANNEVKLKVAIENWEGQVKGHFSDKEYPNGLTKVFVKMNPPKGYENIKVDPLILYWMPISNTSNLNPLFRVQTSSFNNPQIRTEFRELAVFSVSLYLRSLLEKGIIYLEYDMPNIEHRLEKLSKICPRKL